MSLRQSVQSGFATPNAASYPFIAGGIILLIIGIFLTKVLFWIGLLFVLFCFYFFRDPERIPPTKPGLIVSPADGRIVEVQEVIPPAELGLGPELRWKVSIFLSVFNVHINRIPIHGTVTSINYYPGKFFNASLSKSSEFNERNAIRIDFGHEISLGVVQIAGLIARRIICQIKEKDIVSTGDRFGLIRFGSRTDLYLPIGIKPFVKIGQTMVGAETVIAKLPEHFLSDFSSDLLPPKEVVPSTYVDSEEKLAFLPLLTDKDVYS